MADGKVKNSSFLSQELNIKKCVNFWLKQDFQFLVPFYPSPPLLPPPPAYLSFSSRTPVTAHAVSGFSFVEQEKGVYPRNI